MLDLQPAADRLGAVVSGIQDDQFDDRTPCENYQVSGMIGHVLGLTRAFRLAADKDPGMAKDAPAPNADGRADLAAGWREQARTQLADLVSAWRAPAAWEGETEAGGVQLPAPAMAEVVLQELVVHGWDLAKATGQPFDADPAHLQTLHTALDGNVDPNGTPGLFGPPVAVPQDAPLLDRTIGLTGRDPSWSR